MRKYELKDRVRVVNGPLKGHIGEIVQILDRQESCPIYSIKFDGMGITREYAEEDVEAENLIEELIERSYTWDAFIPTGMNEERFFREMAEIYPKYNQDHNIKGNRRFRMSVVEGGEGPVPHVHVYYEHKGSKEDVAYICLGKAEYSPQHIKETKILNSREKKDLIKFFETQRDVFIKDKNGELFQLTCWYEAVRIWINAYGNADAFDVDEETGLYIMPDYTKL